MSILYWRHDLIQAKPVWRLPQPLAAARSEPHATSISLSTDWLQNHKLTASTSRSQQDRPSYEGVQVFARIRPVATCLDEPCSTQAIRAFIHGASEIFSELPAQISFLVQPAKPKSRNAKLGSGFLSRMYRLQQYTAVRRAGVYLNICESCRPGCAAYARMTSIRTHRQAPTPWKPSKNLPSIFAWSSTKVCALQL